MRSVASMSIKRAALVLCGALVAAALPVAAAFAAENPSPEYQYISSSSTFSGDGYSVEFIIEGLVDKADYLTRPWEVISKPTEQLASLTVTRPENSIIIASFEAYPRWLDNLETDVPVWNKAIPYTYSFTFNLTTNEYDGKTVYLYVDHHEGRTEALSSVIENGSFTVHGNLSVYTVVIDLNSGINVNRSPYSPQTGVFNATPFVATLGVAAVVGAGVLAFSLRRKKHSK